MTKCVKCRLVEGIMIVKVISSIMPIKYSEIRGQKLCKDCWDTLCNEFNIPSTSREIITTGAPDELVTIKRIK